VSSLFDELTERLAKDPSLTKRSGPRADLALLMFNARDDVAELWLAAEAQLTRARSVGGLPPTDLAAAVERLRPIFGERDMP